MLLYIYFVCYQWSSVTGTHTKLCKCCSMLNIVSLYLGMGQVLTNSLSLFMNQVHKINVAAVGKLSV